MNEHNECPLTTQEICIMKFRNIKGALAAILGLFTVLLALVIYASNQASGATNQYINVRERMNTLSLEVNTQTIERKVSDKVIMTKIAELQEELVAQRHEQRQLLERILSLQIEFAKQMRLDSSQN
jgi:hypothetical protein